MWYDAASMLFGSIVGLSLALTGGGGAIFAVPLLVYGLSVPSASAVGVSLITVCVTALIGFVQRVRAGRVEFPTGLLFAASGMLTAPLGAWLARKVSEPLLLTLFGGLMLVIAVRMWWTAPGDQRSVVDGSDENAGPACRRDPEGKLRLTSQCAAVLAIAGLVAGVLTGLFGVGGGFIIVPALVTFSGMGFQRAVGTSLLVISLVSLSGIASFFVMDGAVPAGATGLFLAGSLLGLWIGTAVANKLAGPTLQRVFSGAILGVGTFVVLQNLLT